MMKQNQLFIATFSNDAVRLACAHGIGLELNHTCISEMLDPSNREALLEEIRRDMDASGADTPQKLLLHGPFTEIYPAAIDYRARELGMQRLNEAYAVAAALGVTRMIVHNGWLPFIYFKSWQAEKAPCSGKISCAISPRTSSFVLKTCWRTNQICSSI